MSELFGIKIELTLGAEILVDQARATAPPRRRPAAASRCRCGRGLRRAAPRRPRSAPEARASPAESPRAPGCALRTVPRTAPTAAPAPPRRRSGSTGCAASARSRAKASPARSVSAPAASSVKLKTQPSVTSGSKRKPCAIVAGTRIAAGAVNGSVRHVERHLAAALFDQQDLKQVAMAMGADGPVVDRRARGDGFDVNEIERLIVRRIAVQMEQWQRRGHGGSEDRGTDDRRRMTDDGTRTKT